VCVDSLTLVPVQCLSCGSAYVKPAGVGTVKTNPGCPRCGYLGWSFADEDITEVGLRRRFASDPQLHPFSQSR
jgi:predicted  nucleic acid-binding Zn-ribbon protein